MKLKREANIEWILKAKRGSVDKFGYIFGYFGVLTFSNNKSCKLVFTTGFYYEQGINGGRNRWTAVFLVKNVIKSAESSMWVVWALCMKS